MFKILVIDDSALMRKIVRDHLEDAGFEVDELLPGSSSELIEHLHQFQPELVISDFNMPSINGESVTRAVRFSNPQIPIIIMTANRDASRDAKLKAMGVRAILHKPVKAEDLVGTVNKICRQLKKIMPE